MLQTSKLNEAKLAAGRPLDITNATELARAAKAWDRATVLGVDTEFIRERTYFAQLGLIQVSDGQSAWLIDPLAFDGLEPFVAMLRNPAITKVLHAPSEDLELMQNLFSTVPQPMFDTQMAATAVGQPLQMSYNRLVEWLLGEELDSSSTRSNWLRRPLSDAQRHYAALDVTYLPQMHDMLQEKLQASGRQSWHSEDCQRMCEEAMTLPEPAHMYQRLREASRLDQDQINVLQLLASWRELRAREINRPRKFVLTDKNLIDIARSLPGKRSELRDCSELHRRLLEHQGAAILQMVTDGRSSSTQALLVPDPLNGRERKVCQKLQEIVIARAKSLGVEPTWLITRKDLESLIRANGDFSGNNKLMGWRKAAIADELATYLKGNKS